MFQPISGIYFQEYKMKKKKQIPQKNISKKISLKTSYAPVRRDYIGLFLILVITFIVYGVSLSNGFVNWDDDKYIQNNPLITSIDLKALFSKYVMGNYHPLTMLGYAIEYQFFGLNAAGYHVINLLLHLVNTLLVFYAVFYLSNKTIVALIACLFFGIHPMHVESVAWASELKDLLYSFFFLASYIFYLKYVKEQSKKFYFFSLLLFLCSLLSKGMAVSLPVVLLLTDYFKGRKITRQTVIEKIPFFLLAIIFGIIAVYAQKSLGATESTVFPFTQRILFAGYAFINYLIKLLIPLGLSSYYPYPVKVGASVPAPYYIYMIILLGLAIYLFYFHRHSKKIIFGTVFFTVTIFFVLQLLPVGDTIMADRYCYIPSIGLFFLAGEGFYWLWSKKKKLVPVILAGAFIIFFSVQTYARCRVWQNGLTLWNDVIDKYQIIPAAYYNRGLYFFNENQDQEALSDFNKAIELKPDYADAYNNRGSLFIKQGKTDAALNDLNKAISYNRNFIQSYFNRGFLLYQKKQFAEALMDYNKVIELNPDAEKLTVVYNLIAILYMNEKKYNEALDNLNKAIKLRPDFAEAINNRGSLLMKQEKYEEAIRDFTTAIEFRPDYTEAYFNRGIAEFNSGKKDAGCRDWQRASSLGYQPATEAYKNNQCH
jgi:protein O-mannosyl-transferase